MNEPRPAEIDIAPEIKRRLRQVYWRVPFVLVPFAFEMLAAGFHAPPLVAALGFAAIVIGLVVFMVEYYRQSRCPACNRSLFYLFTWPFPYDRCPWCKTRFVSSK